jgi:hypothetical protein
MLRSQFAEISISEYRSSVLYLYDGLTHSSSVIIHLGARENDVWMNSTLFPY